MKYSFTILLFILLSISAGAQTHTPVYLSQTISNASCKGFYRYLPADYASSTKSYPVILWIHGAGQVGQGNTADLPKVLEWGLPKIISEGGFPSSFTVNGTVHSFIVISPQFMGWPSGNNVNAMINYVSNNYRVDAERIYLMGISAGGGGIWDYASLSKSNSDRIAAMIPFCGTMSPTQNLAGRIASSQLPVWAFHNTYDGTVPVANSRNWVNYINSYVPAPNPAAKLTEFPVQSNNAVTAHECWSLATLPTYKPQGINIYEWLLQYKRRIVIANAAPVARAGNDTSIVLPATANLNGYASTDADGIIASYRWRKLSGPASHSFDDSTDANTVVRNLSPGTYQFELKVTDNGGATGTDNITVNVYAAFTPGTLQRVLIDVGSGSNTGSPNNGLFWNNMTDARPGVRVSNAITTLNLPSGLNLQVVNRLDGTYSTSSNGMATGNTTGAVGDYPASATTDLALIHSSGNGLWRIAGMSPSKVYTIKFWGSRTNTSAARTAEIKRADETTWKSYAATGNTNYNNAAVFLISGKTSMDFNIRTKSGSDFSAVGVIDISFGEEETAPLPNTAPLANAGADVTIQYPRDSVLLNGCSSSDAEGAPLKFSWTKISGPASYQIVNDTLCQTTIRNLAEGSYQFELAVTDTGFLVAKDTVRIICNNAPPVANAGNDIVITGSSASVELSAAASFDPEGNALSYRWDILSGSNAGFNSNNIVNPVFTSASAGEFTIMLTVTDNSLQTDTDTLLITVTPPNLLPLANAGADRLHNLPPNFLQLWGTASDEDGTIVAYKWKKISGPSLNFVNDAIANPVLNNLVSGIYELELTVTDNRGGAGKDTMLLTVNAPPVSNAGLNISIIGSSANIQLDGTASTDPEAAALTYEWTIVSGSGASLLNANSATPSFIANAEGIYTIELKVTDPQLSFDLDTVTISIAAANLVPVANAGADKLIHLPPNNTQLNGAGSYDADGNIASYKWRKISGPSMTFSNDALVSPMVNSLVYGIYSFELLVTDNRGATAKDTMVLTVNNPPVANAGGNVSINLPVNSITLNGSASSDIDGAVVGYSWMLAGTGATISTPSAAQTLVTFAGEGTYTFQLTVTDNRGATGIASITITVLPVPTVTAKTLRVNIFGGTNPYNNAQWNNWNVVSSLTSTKFKYDDGAASNVNATITAYGLIADNGANYAAAATACPPAVLRYTSANTSYRILTFNGMSNTKTYDLEFYAGRSNTGNKTSFQVGNRYDTISTDNNLNDVARFTGIVPDNNGRIEVIINRIGTWNYLSGFIVKENSGSSSFARSSPETIETVIETDKTVVTDKLTIHPNPVSDMLLLKIPATISGRYQVSIVNMNGSILLQKTGIKTASSSTDKLNISTLPKGMYSIKVTAGNSSLRTTLVKL